MTTMKFNQSPMQAQEVNFVILQRHPWTQRAIVTSSPSYQLPTLQSLSPPQSHWHKSLLVDCSAIKRWNDHYTLKHFQNKNTEVEFARSQLYIPTFNSKNTWKSLNWKFPPNTINLRKAQNFSQTSFYKEVS